MARPSAAVRAVRLLLLAAVLGFAGWALAGQWTAVRAAARDLQPAWGRVGWSALLVLTSYGVLIATWRAMVAAWGDRIGPGAAARIWFVSNLGRYVPGKVWQIAAMGVMAQEAGVRATAAVGSSLVIALVNLLVGFAVVALSGYDLVARAVPQSGALPWALAALAAVVAVLPWLLPPLVRLTGRLTRRPVEAPELPARALWVAGAGCAVAWVLYGVAFRELAVALLGTATGGAAAYVAVFTLSYLLGFVALFAPGGLGVRELSMAALLVSAGLATEPEAAILVLASRLWLTVLEIAPGLLLLARPPAAPTAPNPPR